MARDRLLSPRTPAVTPPQAHTLKAAGVLGVLLALAGGALADPPAKEAPPPAQQPAPPAQEVPSASALLGTWRVDLRPNPQAPAYFKEMVVAAVGDAPQGTFYGAPIQDVRFNRDWGTLHVAFTTQDSSGVYHHTARLVAPGRLEGTSHSLGRRFLAIWSAERMEPPRPAKPPATP